MAFRILLAGAVAWFAAQFLKFLIEGVRTGKFRAKMLVLPGKMPSAHTATIFAVTTMIYLAEGFSNLFVLALFVAIIIMYDAMTSRRQIGIVTQSLNYTLKKKLRYFEGHTLAQVVAGAVIGIIIAFLISFV